MLLTRLNYRPKPKHANHVRVDYDLGRDYHSSIMKGACTFIPGTLISLSGHLWRGRNHSSISTVNTTPKAKPRSQSTTTGSYMETGSSKGSAPTTARSSDYANTSSGCSKDYGSSGSTSPSPKNKS